MSPLNIASNEFGHIHAIFKEIHSMLSSLAQYWWVAVARGVLAIVFGLAAIVWPGVTLASLILLFGAYVLVDGVVTLGMGLFGLGRNDQRAATVLSGVLGVLAGIVTFLQPAAAAFAMLYVVAGWGMITGVLQIATAIRLRKHISNEWLVGLGGSLSVLFSVLLLAAPAAGVVTLVFLFGYYAISAGVVQIGFGLRLRGLTEHLPLLHRCPSTSPAR
jgi:uncharacterized membrane protein HdeD (DUF308 family)